MPQLEALKINFSHDLWRQEQRGPTKAELERMVDLFHRQEWTLLLDETRHSSSGLRRKTSPLTTEEEKVRRARRAETLVHQGEVSRARQVQCSQARAPGTRATLNELRDPERSPPRLSEAIPPEVSGHCPQHQFKLDRRKYACNLGGSAAGLALLICRRKLPTPSVWDSHSHSEGEWQHQGHRYGDTFCRGVARTMAQQCAKIFEEACVLYQYALHTRAGTECVARVVRLLTELDPKKTLLSIDGVGAFDHIKRKSMLEALHNNPALAPLLPFVRTFHGKDSTYVWYDDEGGAPRDLAGRGGRARGPPHAALYALDQHAAPSQVDASLHEGEMFFAFLDDIYILCDPSRVGEIFLQVKQSLGRFAGVQVNLGKTKVWNRAATKHHWSQGVEGEGPEEEHSLVVLGVPVGHSAFVQKWLADKEESHQEFLTRIPAVQVAQCAWLLLLMCAGPRANHILRNLPPSEVSQFAQNHDTSLRACLAEILAVPVPVGVVAEVAQLPFRERGLGLRSAMRLAPAPYWTSWADCLSQVHARAPPESTQLLQELEGPPSRAQCVGEAQDAAALLAGEGMEVPDWSRFTVPEFHAPQPVNPEVGEWIHGWQFHTSVARDTLYATCVHLPPLSTDHQESSARCCWSDCICPFMWTSASANAVNLWTCLVTTGQHVLGLGSRSHVGLPQKCAWRESAEKQALVSRRINFFVILMSSFPRTTSAGSRSSRTAFHFREASRSPSTPQWSQR